MYKVVNHDWNQSLPDIFTTFEEAFEAQKSWDNQATIEFFTPDYVEIVWSPKWENITDIDLNPINIPVQETVIQ